MMKRWLTPGLLLAATAAAPQMRQAAPDSVDLRRAEQEFQDALQAEPTDTLALYNLGTVLVLQGRYEEARPYLESAARSSTIAAQASYNLGATDLEPAFLDADLSDRDERLRRAIEAYKEALLADSTDEDAKWNLELARRLLEREQRDASGGGGGGGGGGGQGQPLPGTGDPSPTPAAGGGGQPQIEEIEAENLLRSAREQELDVQRDRLRKPQPPGPIRP